LNLVTTSTHDQNRSDESTKQHYVTPCSPPMMGPEEDSRSLPPIWPTGSCKPSFYHDY